MRRVDCIAAWRGVCQGLQAGRFIGQEANAWQTISRDIGREEAFRHMLGPVSNAVKVCATCHKKTGHLAKCNVPFDIWLTTQQSI